MGVCVCGGGGMRACVCMCVWMGKCEGWGGVRGGRGQGGMGGADAGWGGLEHAAPRPRAPPPHTHTPSTGGRWRRGRTWLNARMRAACWQVLMSWWAQGWVGGWVSGWAGFCKCVCGGEGGRGGGGGVGGEARQTQAGNRHESLTALKRPGKKAAAVAAAAAAPPRLQKVCPQRVGHPQQRPPLPQPQRRLGVSCS